MLLALGRPRAAVSHAVGRPPVGPARPRGGLHGVVRLTDPDRWRRGRGLRDDPRAAPAGRVWPAGPLRVTSAARTLVDCAREWPLEDAVVAMDAALLAGRTTADDCATAAPAVRRWPGAARAARAVALADGRAESPLETRGRSASSAPASHPELQVEIHADGRLVGVVDAWFDEAAVAVEFDGRIKYTDPWRGRSPERGAVGGEAAGGRPALAGHPRRPDRRRRPRRRLARHENGCDHLLTVPGPAVRRFTARPRERGVRRTA